MGLAWPGKSNWCWNDFITHATYRFRTDKAICTEKSGHRHGVLRPVSRCKKASLCEASFRWLCPRAPEVYRILFYQKSGASSCWGMFEYVRLRLLIGSTVHSGLICPWMWPYFSDRVALFEREGGLKTPWKVDFQTEICTSLESLE